nr:MAG TPA: hypothetical protein [Caudoviricetes sp.]
MILQFLSLILYKYKIFCQAISLLLFLSNFLLIL